MYETQGVPSQAHAWEYEDRVSVYGERQKLQLSDPPSQHLPEIGANVEKRTKTIPW